MDDNPYEIIPHQLLADLRSEVEALKQKLLEPDSVAKELLVEMNSLREDVGELREVFKNALKETKETGALVKIETLIEQNKTIAHGMVALSDKIEQLTQQKPSSVQRPPVSHPPPRSSSLTPGAHTRSMSRSIPSMPAGPQSSNMDLGSQQHYMGVPPSKGGPSRTAPMPDLSIDMPPPPPDFENRSKKKGFFG